ncbi:hypothetical protein [Kitasatospora sp. NPDC093679]|uniref:hypothetical protein n=1 Tax=Kitasatospora sp. NPDC093679 TaxID=3154983 RepID=UPI003414181B
MSRRSTLAGAAAVALVASAAVPAWAGQGNGNGSSTPTSIESQVSVVASDSGAGGKHLVSVGGSWTPPACWYEPHFTADQYDQYWQDLLAAMPPGSFKSDAQKQYDALKAENFNRDKAGQWWVLVKSKAAWDLPVTDQCTQNAGAIFVPPAGPPAGVPAVTPQMLSKIAYAATKLPPPQVKLSPAADKQTVNLATYVSFGQPLSPVTVTASLDYAGVRIAASTLAVPTSLHVDAGTDDASPRSCTYSFTKSGSGYQVDSSGANCNITYQRSSRGGTYPLTAEVTWKVTWTPSTNPYGAPANPLPNGLTGGVPQDVVVKEIQTIVTG